MAAAIAQAIITVMTPIWKIVFLFILINAATLIAINNKLMFGWLFSIFGYNYMDIYELKGWNGIGKIWRAFNRKYLFEGLFLSLFSSETYTKNEIADELMAMQNYAMVMRIFLTAGFLMWLGVFVGSAVGGPGVGAALMAAGGGIIFQATVFRLVVISSIADLILNSIFYLKSQDGIQYKAAIDSVGDKIEAKLTELDTEIKIKLDTQAEKAIEENELISIKSTLKDIKKRMKRGEKFTQNNM